MRKKYVLTIFVYISIYIITLSNDVVLGIKYFDFSVHPKGAINVDLMPYKLDSCGYAVLKREFFKFRIFLKKDVISIKLCKEYMPA